MIAVLLTEQFFPSVSQGGFFCSWAAVFRGNLEEPTSREASGPVVVVISTAVSHLEQHQKREMMGGVGVRLQARCELLHQMAPQYRAAPPVQKHFASLKET